MKFVQTILLLCLTALMLFAGCAVDDPTATSKETFVFEVKDVFNWCDETNDGIDRELAEKVAVGMTLSEIANLVGQKPHRRVQESSSHMYEWDIESGGQLRVVLRARRVANSSDSLDDSVETKPVYEIKATHVSIVNKE